METIIIDERFKGLLPALDKETFRLLEENILKHGCLTPLVLWGGILIDGYNRHEICTRHDIPFETVEKDFASREAVLIWIISNQVSRRNLTPLQLSHFRGLHYKADRVIVTNERGKNQFSEVDAQIEHQPRNQQTTAGRLADQYNVSSATIRRDSKIADGITAIGEVSPEAKRRILSGEITINRGKLENLSSMPAEEIEAVAVKIENGTYKRRQPSHQSPPGGEEGVPAEPGAALRHLDAAVSGITDDFSKLRERNDTEGIAELKRALRPYIKALEDLYVGDF